MKKRVLFLLVSLMIISSVMCASASEISPMRAEACPYCNGGSMVTVVRTQEDSFSGPCQHNHPGYLDILIYTYRRTFYECNRCGRGSIISEQFINTQFICEYNP